MCISPHLPAGWASQTQLSVSLNSRDLSSPLPFTFVEPPGVPTLSPGCGPVSGNIAAELAAAQRECMGLRTRNTMLEEELAQYKAWMTSQIARLKGGH